MHAHIPSIDFAVYSRQEVLLTDEQVSTLRRRVAEFRLADSDTRPTIIQDAVSELERSWTHDTDFDRELVETVRASSAAGFSSHTFVDGSQIFL